MRLYCLWFNTVNPKCARRHPAGCGQQPAAAKPSLTAHADRPAASRMAVLEAFTNSRTWCVVPPSQQPCQGSACSFSPPAPCGSVRHAADLRQARLHAQLVCELCSLPAVRFSCHHPLPQAHASALGLPGHTSVATDKRLHGDSTILRSAACCLPCHAVLAGLSAFGEALLQRITKHNHRDVCTTIVLFTGPCPAQSCVSAKGANEGFSSARLLMTNGMSA